MPALGCGLSACRRPEGVRRLRRASDGPLRPGRRRSRRRHASQVCWTCCSSPNSRGGYQITPLRTLRQDAERGQLLADELGPYFRRARARIGSSIVSVSCAAMMRLPAGVGYTPLVASSGLWRSIARPSVDVVETIVRLRTHGPARGGQRQLLLLVPRGQITAASSRKTSLPCCRGDAYGFDHRGADTQPTPLARQNHCRRRLLDK